MAALVSDANGEFLDDLDAFLRKIKDDVGADVEFFDLADCELDLSFAGNDSATIAPLERSGTMASVVNIQTHRDEVGLAACQPPAPRTHQEDVKTDSRVNSLLLARATKKKRDQNRSRKRQREELQELRVAATQLQSQLEALLCGDRVNDGCTGGGGGDGVASPSTPDELALSLNQKKHALHLALAWKRAAVTAKQTHEFAMMENFRLRALIQENDVVCSSLRDAYTKHCAARDASPANLCRSPARPTAAFDLSLFESLRTGLDEHCERLNTFWGISVFTDPWKEIKQPSCLKRDGNDVFLERLHSRILPFSPDAIKCAIWDLLRTGALTPTRGEVKVRATVGNTLCLTIEDTITVPGFQDTSVKVWVVVKEVTTETRVVLAWQALTELETAGSVTQLRGHGWKVMQSLATAFGRPESLQSAPCVWQTCIRSRPEQHGRALTEHELAPGSFVPLAVDQADENMSMLSQAIENILMDGSLRATVAS